MNTNATSNMAKAMKWIPILLGVVSLILAGVTLLVKMEDATSKYTLLLFAFFGLFGISLMVVGYGFSAMFESLSRIEEKPSREGDEDEEIPPGA